MTCPSRAQRMPSSATINALSLNIAIPILREVFFARDQLPDALDKLLGLTGDLKRDGRQRLCPHAPLAVALVLAIGGQFLTALASLHQTLLGVGKASDHVTIARCFGLGHDFAHRVDDGADQRLDSADVSGATDQANEALDGLHQDGGLIVKVYLFNVCQYGGCCRYEREDCKLTLRSSVLESTRRIPYPLAAGGNPFPFDLL